MKKTALLTAFLIMTAATPAFSDEDKNKLISVTGEAVLYVEPDQVQVNMTVEVNDKDLKLAQKKNDEITSKVLQLATTKLRIEDNEIQTNYITVQPVYSYNKMCGTEHCPQPELTHFTTQKGIAITLKDTSVLQELLEKSLEAGVTRIDGVEFTSSKLEELKGKAQIIAAKAAKQKADAIAGALNVKVGMPYKINTDHSQPSPYKASLMAASALGSAQNTIATGQIEIRSNVNVDFEIED